ncbi:phage terminase small subunit [Endozoicomonas montiporae]|uniref:Putative terminase, endonuclease subunit n=1 Tax=Endozoicomonas montiporae CL-33 TaxID=570277 RepID=A0A142BCT8_9GAMM|nr:phage terminase small subunit [Endozoicomonas montiporae]AMO56564.1 putative terminase, endonuclease subunit [Endozoicomonas montiporae CL-33]
MNYGWDFKQRMQQKKKAAKEQQRIEAAARETLQVTAKDYQQFQLLLASLESDLKRLSAHPTGEPRDTIKRDELIPRYLPYVTEYREQGEVFKNPVLVQLVIWFFDTGQIHQAIDWALLAIEQKQPMPERFNRSLQTFVADCVLDWSKMQKARGDGIEPYFSQVFQRLMDDHWPVPAAVQAKYHKQAGDLTMEAGQLQQALNFYVRAMELDPRRAKCITRINEIRKKLDRAESAVSSGDVSPPAVGTLAGGAQAESLETPESQGEPTLIDAGSFMETSEAYLQGEAE